MNIGRLLQRIVPLIIVLAGVAVLILGIVRQIHTVTYETTTAVITRIDSREVSGDDGPETRYDVEVEYSVGGKTYTAELGYHEDDYTVGKQVEIRYDPHNPAAIFAAGTSGIPTIIIGVIMVVVGGAPLWKTVGLILLQRGQTAG